ncbi:MAG TPA: hypothetical protein DF383_09005 [Deltaproteobacteria bacterium]|nr:hypothetical protein [Deltaproteobacteria bacterium]
MFVSTTGNDDSGNNNCQNIAAPCLTIQAAVEQAALTGEDDVINVAAGNYTDTGGTEAFAEISAGNNVNIVGAGAQNTVLNCPGNSGCRGMMVSSGATVSASNLTIQNGQDSSTDAEGTGIRNSGNLTLNNVIIQNNNTFDSDGGGIFNGSFDPMEPPATLLILNSTISGNRARGTGGGIANGGGGNDMAVGVLTMVNCTVSGNTSGTDSDGNSAGGGIFNHNGSSTTLFNVTIANNTANNTNGTVNGGGGIHNNGGNLFINNTLIADNNDASSADANDCLGVIGSTEGHNLVEDTTGCTLAGTIAGNITGVDPTLGALADNGGPTPTHALLESSVAIDSGDPAGCIDNTGANQTTDQRGSNRPVAGISGDAPVCDIGAFEAAAGTTPNGGGGGGCSITQTDTSTGNILLASLLLSALFGFYGVRRKGRASH